MKTSSLSRREKLLLGLLSSTLIFSASFSYGAVNSSKVDAIMQTITNAGNAFTTQEDRDTYYQRVYTGLADAVALLITVQNNVGAMIGTAPVTVPPVGTLPPVNTVNPGQSAAQVLGIFANTPIPAPCPANTIVMKEDLGKEGGGAWLRRKLIPSSTNIQYHVYKISLTEGYDKYLRAQQTNSSWRISLDSQYVGHALGAKISPYPCDFMTDADLKKESSTTSTRCMGSQGNFEIPIVGGSQPLGKTNPYTCDLKLGGTYYVNIGPLNIDQPNYGMPTGVDPYKGMGYSLQNYFYNLTGSPIYGVYTPGLETGNLAWETWKDTANPSGENAETLRQTVVNSYRAQIGSQTSGITGEGVFIYRVKTLASQTEANKAQTDLWALQCISSLDELRRINPDTIGPNNPNGYEYSTYRGLGKDCYFNVKDHTHVVAWSKNPEVKNRPANIPDSCRVGTKFVANAERGIVLAECVSREYAYGIGKSSPNCTDDPKAVVFDLNKMRGNSTFTEEASYAKGEKAGIEFTKNPGETKTSEVISIRIDLRDGKFDPDILPKKITDVPSYYQNDEYPTWGASWYTSDKLWQRYDGVSTELATLSQCAGDFNSSEARVIGGYRSDTPITTFSQLVMGQLDHPSRKLQLLEGSEKIVNGIKNIFLQPGSVWYLNYRVQYGMNRSSPYTIPLKEDGIPYPSNKTTWPFASAPINTQFGYKQPCSLQNDGSIKEGCLDTIDRNTFKSFFSSLPNNAQPYWSTIAW